MLKYLCPLKNQAKVFTNEGKGIYGASVSAVTEALAEVTPDPEEGRQIFTVYLRYNKGVPAVLTNTEAANRFFAQKLKGTDYYPFAEPGDNTKIDKITVIIKPQNGVYVLCYAGFGDAYEQDAKHEFWNRHSFNKNIVPRTMSSDIEQAVVNVG